MFAAVWVLDRWDMGAVFIPGQFAGYAAANAVGVAIVMRWQRLHDGRLLARPDDDVTLYSDAAAR